MPICRHWPNDNVSWAMDRLERRVKENVNNNFFHTFSNNSVAKLLIYYRVGIFIKYHKLFTFSFCRVSCCFLLVRSGLVVVGLLSFLSAFSFHPHHVNHMASRANEVGTFRYGLLVFDEQSERLVTHAV